MKLSSKNLRNVTVKAMCSLILAAGVLATSTGCDEEMMRVFGEAFVELDDDGCCGFGGSFSLDHYDLSKEIARAKIESIERSGADVVVTACPGCLVQLIDNIERHGIRQRAVHISEAIAPDKGS